MTRTSASSWGAHERARERSLLQELARIDITDSRRDALRDELVTMHLPLVRHIAWGFRDRGEQFEDIVQVGTIGLIKAVDRFEIDRGLEFSTYATPLIVGEIKRHFRDRTSVVRLPRRLQELSASVSRASDALTIDLQRSPTVREIADSVGCSVDEVLEALEARESLTVHDLPTIEGESILGADDTSLQGVVDREALRTALEQLPERERQIVMLRFFRDMSQTQIAHEMGISQMHVSRLLSASLGQLRGDLAA